MGKTSWVTSPASVWALISSQPTELQKELRVRMRSRNIGDPGGKSESGIAKQYESLREEVSGPTHEARCSIEVVGSKPTRGAEPEVSRYNKTCWNLPRREAPRRGTM